MNNRALTATMLGLLLTGCALTPDYDRPAPAIAERYPGTEQAAQPAEPAATDSTHWQGFFGDQHLHHLIALALEHNRDLRTAIAQTKEARALYGIQRADQVPNIGLGALRNRGRTPADLSYSGSDVTASQYQVALNLSAWELDFWGRVRNLKDAALEAYLASEEGRRATAVALIAQVANAYLLERELDERVAIAEQTLSTRATSRRIMQRRYEVGTASKLDATQAEILWNQARSELAALKRERERSHHALTLLVGTPIPIENRPLSAIETSFTRPIAPGLPSELLANRPDILAAEHQLRATQANIAAARANFYPRITLTGDLGTASASLENLFNNGSGAWSFAPSATLPIFDGGRNRANLQATQARRERAVAVYQKTVQTAFREVADALSDHRWIAEQVAVQRQTMAAQTERTRLANLRYQSGAASYLEVLDAERDRFNVEQALVQLRRAYLASSVNLYAALGGGDGLPNEPKDMSRNDLSPNPMPSTPRPSFRQDNAAPETALERGEGEQRQ